MWACRGRGGRGDSEEHPTRAAGTSMTRWGGRRGVRGGGGRGGNRLGSDSEVTAKARQHLLLQPLGVHLARVLATPVAQREDLVAAREAAHVHQPNALPTRKARHAQIAPRRSARRAPCGARRAAGAGAAAAARGGGSVTARQAPRRLLAGEDDCARRAQRLVRSGRRWSAVATGGCKCRQQPRLLSALPPPLLAFPAPPPRVRLGVAGRALRLGAALLWRRRNRPRDGLVPAHCELHRRRR